MSDGEGDLAGDESSVTVKELLVKKLDEDLAAEEESLLPATRSIISS